MIREAIWLNCWPNNLIYGGLRLFRRPRPVAVLFWIYAVVWTVLLLVPEPGRFFFLPISPPSDIDYSTVPIDKIAHAGGYFVFMLLAGAAFNSEPAGIALAWLVSASAAHGAITELLQLAIPPREGDWADVVTDVAGVGLGTLAWWLLRRFMSKPSRAERDVRP